ncbi:MAG: tautomerase family protein [Alphaproteobacteria bacterium]|nr:tautomerase family protein [Alphaproteobacteria bacterium]
MPLLQFHVIEGRSHHELAALLDATHRVVVETLHVPQRDRYQIVHEHKPSRVRFEDTGLGIPRSEKFVLLQITSKHHTTEQKTAFYQKLCAELERFCGIEPTDVMVSIVANSDEDWSFGLGRAQFLTGELGGVPSPQTPGQPTELATASRSGRSK